MLNLKKRHTPKCPHRHKGPDFMNCRCPIRADGMVDGRRVRVSLGRDRQRAAKRLMELEANGVPVASRSVSDAAAAFLADRADLADGTMRNYKRTFAKLAASLHMHGVTTVDDVTVEHLDCYRQDRGLSSLSWSKDIERLRSFFGFCHDRGWSETNPAKKLRMPKLKPTPKDPFTADEIIRLRAAANAIGNGPYERLRARAIVLVLRHTAMRLSDVAALKRSSVQNGRIETYALKNGKPIWLPITPEVVAALEAIPVPRGTIGASEYFFWSGNGTLRSLHRDITRTMDAVFTKAGFPAGDRKRSHRFRHTLATELLGRGATAEDVETILGTSAALIRKHYAQWSIKRQERIESLLQPVVTGTELAQSIQTAATC